MAEPIRIFIVDDHQMFIDGIKALLRNVAHLQFVGEANDGKSALEFLAQQPVDLLITDVQMGEMDGVELTRRVKAMNPDIKVLVITMHNDQQIIGEMLLAEAEGYVLKNTGKQELTRAIQSLAEGGTHYSREVLGSMMQKVKKEHSAREVLKGLTDREMDVLKLICQEFSTQDIADALFISPRTVDTHRKNIMLKTESRTIVGLIKYAFRNGILG